MVGSMLKHFRPFVHVPPLFCSCTDEHFTFYTVHRLREYVNEEAKGTVNTHSFDHLNRLCKVESG